MAVRKTTYPCTRCGAPTVDIALFADGRLTMRSCSACDHRTWLRGEVAAPFDDVLATVAGAAAAGRRRLGLADSGSAPA